MFQLKKLGSERDDLPKAWVFFDWTFAFEHVCDHLLTRPEADLWGVIPHGLGDSVPAEENAFGLARQIWDTKGTAGQDLYDRWCEAIRWAVARSAELGWHWRDCNCTIYFAPNGVKTVVSVKAVRTCFIPINSVLLRKNAVSATGDDERTPESVATRRMKNPLPRQGAWRRAEPHGQHRRTHAEIKERGPEDQAYRVYRDAAKIVRTEFFALLSASDDLIAGASRAHAAFRRPIADREEWRLLNGGPPETASKYRTSAP